MDEDRPRPPGGSARVYRLLLRAFPAPFRERHGEAMVRAFRERRRDAADEGTWRLCVFWIRTLLDVAANARRSGSAGGREDDVTGRGPEIGPGRSRPTEVAEWIRS